MPSPNQPVWYDTHRSYEAPMTAPQKEPAGSEREAASRLLAAVEGAVKAISATEAREAFEYATNTSATGVPMRDVRARVVQGVLDCEVSVAGVDVCADEWKETL